LIVPTDPGIAEFVEKALASGIPHDSLVGILTARGWPEKEVYDALAGHYQRLTGIEVPRRAAAAGASAKDAFFYLLIFATLATWTIALGCLAFNLIDRWIADPLFNAYRQTYDSYTITASLAALIVAFPLYLLISRAPLRAKRRSTRKSSTPPSANGSPISPWSSPPAFSWATSSPSSPICCAAS
jgi:hypothetical protein